MRQDEKLSNSTCELIKGYLCSSLGQIFDASHVVIETVFSCVVIIIGLILLADLIARMQVPSLSMFWIYSSSDHFLTYLSNQLFDGMH